MTNDKRVRVILVDDHRMVRQGVRAFLSTQTDLDVIGEADTGEGGIALADELRPDVALVDLVMDGMSGIDATTGIRAASPATEVMILTSFDDQAMIFPAVRAGARSYLLKDVDSPALADAVRATARGESVLHPRVARRLVNQMRGDHERPGGLDQLTERELEVLHHVAQGSSNAAIATNLSLSEKTVKGHVSSVLAKLGLADRTQAAVFAWRNGIAQQAP